MPASQNQRYRPSDATLERFCSWLALNAVGIGLLIAGDSLLSRFGIMLVCGSGLVVTPPREFQRALKPREYVPVLGFFLLLPLVIVVAVFVVPSSLGRSTATDDTLPLWLKAVLTILWAGVATVEGLRFRRLRRTGAA